MSNRPPRNQTERMNLRPNRNEGNRNQGVQLRDVIIENRLNPGFATNANAFNINVDEAVEEEKKKPETAALLVEDVFNSNYGEDSLTDLRKIYYSQNPENDLKDANKVFIAPINESVEYCENNGIALDTFNSFPGVMVYTKDEKNNKTVLLEYENQRLLKGIFECPPFNTRFAEVSRGATSDNPIKREVVTINATWCTIITLILKEIFDKFYKIIGYITRIIEWILSKFGCRIDCDGGYDFEKDVKIHMNNQIIEASVEYDRPCPFKSCRDNEGIIKIAGNEKYFIRSKKLRNTCCTTPPYKGETCGGTSYVFCYDKTIEGFVVVDIVQEIQEVKKKVGEIILYPREQGRINCCGCSFFGKRNVVEINFPAEADLQDKFAILAFGINFGESLSKQGKSYY